MLNTTSKVIPYFSPNCAGVAGVAGVVLPHSAKLRSSQEIDAKIEKTKRHLEYLTAQLPLRTTHGGKNFRAKKISLRDQISLASEELFQLRKAEKLLLEYSFFHRGRYRNRLL